TSRRALISAEPRQPRPLSPPNRVTRLSTVITPVVPDPLERGLDRVRREPVDLANARRAAEDVGSVLWLVRGSSLTKPSKGGRNEVHALDSARRHAAAWIAGVGGPLRG